MSVGSLLAFTACESGDAVIDDLDVTPQRAYGTLDLTLAHGPLPGIVQRSVAEGLAVQLVRPDHSIYREYAAGSVPEKIQLEAGVTYTLRAYSENQATWQTANAGKGEACYYGETTVSVAADEVTKVVYAVPMTNYAVTLTLPDIFDVLFKSYTFTVGSNGRSVTLKEGEKAYFPGGHPFTYQLLATNTDDRTSQHTAVEYPDTQIGKLYNIHYTYATEFTSGGIDIEITDNSEHEDVEIKV